MTFPWGALPATIALLNLASAVALGLGFYFIRRRQVAAHRRCMLTAFATSIIFLAAYVAHHLHSGVVYFRGGGRLRTLYLWILGTHTPLAVIVPAMAIVTLRLAWRGNFARHRRWARVTLPIWMYVSLTGIAVYWMLYRL